MYRYLPIMSSSVDTVTGIRITLKCPHKLSIYANPGLANMLMPAEIPYPTSSCKALSKMMEADDGL